MYKERIRQIEISAISDALHADKWGTIQVLIESQTYNNHGRQELCFQKTILHPEVEVQGKLVTMVEEEDEDVMLAAPVTLHNSGVKKRQPKKVAKPVVNQRQLRAIYEDPQGHESLEDTTEDMDEEEDLPAGPIRESNQRVFQETSANPRLPQTRTTKTGRVQELVVPKIPKKADSIRAMTGSERFDIKKIFNLPLEVTVGEFFDRFDSTIRKMVYNI